MAEARGRRRFLKNLSALGATGAVAPIALDAQAQHAGHLAQASIASGRPEQTAQQVRRYLTQAEFDFVEAAASRLIPADDLGPGAKEAGAAYFIDGQLESSWGTMGRNYRQGPWPESVPQQGYQLPHTPQDVYRAGIRDTNAYCEKRFGKTFDGLTAAEQDEVLRGLEGGKVELPGVPSRAFFSMLLNNTMESFFADPMYGGNRDKIGWKLVGFPGVAAAYTRYLGQYNTPYRVEPVSILDVENRVAKLDEHGHPVHTRLTER